MDSEAVTRLLKLRSQLTRNPYGQGTIDAWTEALFDVSEDDATTALRHVVADGVSSIGIPELRGWLRAERRRQEIQYQSASPASPYPDDYERDPRQRSAIVAAFRAAHPNAHRVVPKETR